MNRDIENIDMIRHTLNRCMDFVAGCPANSDRWREQFAVTEEINRALESIDEIAARLKS